MKTTKLFLATALALTARAALAADAFTISVPVEFHSLNATVIAVRIRCTLSARDAVTGSLSTFGPAKSVDLPLTGGNYTGPSPLSMVFQTADFTAAQQAVLSSVTGGRCQFNLVTPTGLYIPYGGETTPVLAQRPGTPFRSSVNFTFP